MPRPTQLIGVLSPWRPGLDPRSMHVRFVVDGVALGRIFLPVFRVSLVSLIPSVLYALFHLHVALTSRTNGRSVIDCVWNDSTCAETRFRLSAKRPSPFKSAGASVQSSTGTRGVRISGSRAGYTMFRGSVKSTGYPLLSPFPPFTSPPMRHRVPSHFNWNLTSHKAMLFRKSGSNG